MNEIYDQLDYFYAHQQLDEAYAYLFNQLNKAMQDNRDDLVLGLLSELMGYYRVTSQFDLGYMIASQSEKILLSHGLENTIEAGTCYLNMATLYRAGGRYLDALDYYHKVETIYQKLDDHDERLASFYNNISLLYEELGELNKAIDYETKALSIMKDIHHSEVEIAITYSNLAQMYYQLDKNDQALEYLNQSLLLFESLDYLDTHYYAALSLKAYQYSLDHQYEQSLQLYDDILEKLNELYGHNKEYQIVLENKKNVESQLYIKGLQLCEQYYQQYGIKMLENFKEYLPYMAIGLCGEGSDCLGYDDELSHDHDFGPGFCIWLPRDIYDEIYTDLQQAYDDLPKSFMGYQRNTTPQATCRVGVQCIDDFFTCPQNDDDWLNIDEMTLLNCTNGKIFIDNYGLVTKIREDLSYYPKHIQIIKLADNLHLMSQCGQYNYQRILKRNDKVALELCVSSFIDATISVVYILNKKYKPYYKWSYYGLKDCVILNDLRQSLDQLVESENKEVIMESICQRVIFELKKLNLTTGDSSFLDDHVSYVLGV
ncbi:MAG: DUF4037 domain-containing protein [Erysipelotrichaceae bacterium]|nr:DUF4037 domain-containing protein [Erysipelotrichaceae bacterium]